MATEPGRVFGESGLTLARSEVAYLRITVVHPDLRGRGIAR